MENRDVSFDVNAKIEIFLDYNELDLYSRKEKSSKNGRNFCSFQIKVHEIVSYFFNRNYSSRVASTTDVIDSVITCDKLKINSYNYFLVHISKYFVIMYIFKFVLIFIDIIMIAVS